MMCKKTCFFVRDGALIGDFKDAQNPMVWRMDLSRVHAAGFRVVQNGSSWELTIEGPTGAPAPIASYDSVNKANRALRRLSCALRASGAGVWRRWIVKGLVVIGFVTVLYYSIPYLGRISIGTQPSSTAVLPLPSGQSMSADQVLQAPPPATPGR